MRYSGPLVSSRIAMGRFSFFAHLRQNPVDARLMLLDGVPCEKFSRATFMPARHIFSQRLLVLGTGRADRADDFRFTHSEIPLRLQEYASSEAAGLSARHKKRTSHDCVRWRKSRPRASCAKSRHKPQINRALLHPMTDSTTYPRLHAQYSTARVSLSILQTPAPC